MVVRTLVLDNCHTSLRSLGYQQYDARLPVSGVSVQLPDQGIGPVTASYIRVRLSPSRLVSLPDPLARPAGDLGPGLLVSVFWPELTFVANGLANLLVL